MTKTIDQIIAEAEALALAELPMNQDPNNYAIQHRRSAIRHALRLAAQPEQDLARITALEAENERMREREKRDLSDTSRLIWRDEVEGICPSLDMCFEYGDHVRCGPCAVKASLTQGVEPNLALPALPEVSRLKRENERMKAAFQFYMSQFGQALEAHGIPHSPSQIEADALARQALGAPHDAD